jgi:hypothetical protein
VLVRATFSLEMSFDIAVIISHVSVPLLETVLQFGWLTGKLPLGGTAAAEAASRQERSLARSARESLSLLSRPCSRRRNRAR